MPTFGDVQKYYKRVGDRWKFVNWRKAVKPYHLHFQNQQGQVTVPSSAAAGPLRLNYRPDFSSNQGLDRSFGTPFLWQGTVFEAGAATGTTTFINRLSEEGASRRLMDQFHHIRNIAGVAQTPAVLREPMIIDSHESIVSELINSVAATVNTRIFLVGSLFCPWSNRLAFDQGGKQELLDLIGKFRVRKRYVTPFWVSPDDQENNSITLAASGTNLDFFHYHGDDSVLELFGMTSVSTGAYALEVSLPEKRQVISNGKVTNTNAVGSANFPLVFPTSLIIHPGYRLRFRFDNLTGAPNTVFLTLFGRKIYAPPSKVQQVLEDTRVPTPQNAPFLPYTRQENFTEPPPDRTDESA